MRNNIALVTILVGTGLLFSLNFYTQKRNSSKAHSQEYVALQSDFQKTLSGSGDWVPDTVLGQRDFTQTAVNSITGNRVFYPEGVIIDTSVRPNRMYVADGGNNRILGFSSLGTCRDSKKACSTDSDCINSSCEIDAHKKADIIIGQKDEYSGACNGNNTKDMSPTAASMCQRHYPRLLSPYESNEPTTMAIGKNGDLYTWDKWNNRVLKYTNPFNTDAVADFVWGQPDFTTKDCLYFSPSESTLCGNPDFVWFPNKTYPGGDFSGTGLDVDTKENKLWTVDPGNNRVLRFPLDSNKADLVIGQKDFVTNKSSACLDSELARSGVVPNSDQLCKPKTVQYDESTKSLYILDWPSATETFRIMVYKAPFVSGMKPDDVIVGGTSKAHAFNLSRPTAITIDKDKKGSFWLSDSGHGRLLYFQKIDLSWVITKALGKNSLNDYEWWGGGICPLGNQGPPWLCAIVPVGSVGVDSDKNLLVANVGESQLFRYTSPIPELNSSFSNYPASSIFLSPHSDEGVRPEPNNVDRYSFANPGFVRQFSYNSTTTVKNKETARQEKQFYVTDRRRLLFWNSENLSTHAPANGALYQKDFYSQSGTISINTIEVSYEKETLFVVRGNTIDGFHLPLTQNSKPYVTINSGSLKTSDKTPIDWKAISGIAYDNTQDVLWVADTEMSRILRIKKPLDEKSRVVDMVLGQPDSLSTRPHCATYAKDSILPYQFGSIGQIRLDRKQNLYVVDAIHEGWACSNNRILEFDAKDLRPIPGKVFQGSGEIAPMRVYGSGAFTSKAWGNEDVPNTPISVGFSADNKMIVLADGYSNPLGKRVFMYENHLPNCISPCKVQNPKVLPISGAQLTDLDFDADGNLAVLDHTWNRILLFDKPFEKGVVADR